MLHHARPSYRGLRILQKLRAMPRRAASITQADIARVVRAAKQAGASEVEVRMRGGDSIVIRMESSKTADEALAESKEIVL